MCEGTKTGRSDTPCEDAAPSHHIFAISQGDFVAEIFSSPTPCEETLSSPTVQCIPTMADKKVLVLCATGKMGKGVAHGLAVSGFEVYGASGEGRHECFRRSTFSPLPAPTGARGGLLLPTHRRSHFFCAAACQRDARRSSVFVCGGTCSVLAVSPLQGSPHFRASTGRRSPPHLRHPLRLACCVRLPLCRRRRHVLH